MWVAELKLWHEGSATLELSKKYDVTVRGFYYTAFSEGNEVRACKIMIIEGKDAEKFKREIIKREGRLHIYHVEGNHLFYEIRKPWESYQVLMLSKDIFMIKPWLIKDGIEYWTLAFWDKAALQRLFKRMKKSRFKVNAEVKSLRERQVNLLIPTSLENLTSKQLEAFRVALANGYYEFPRNMSLKMLARRLKTPMSTLREHLRKAEMKLLGNMELLIGAR